MSAYVDSAKVKCLTESGIVTTIGKAGILYSVNIHGSSTDALVIINNGGASGTVVAYIGQGVANESRSYTLRKGIVCDTDIYAVISGTNPVVTIEYDEIGK